MLRNLLAVLLSLASACPFASSQASPPNQNPIDDTTIRSIAHEVLLDLVVRDKHHRPVANLRPEEIQVYEDGVPQKILAFHAVQGTEELQAERDASTGAAGTSSPDAPSRPLVTPLHQLNFVAVVFADIAPLNLEFARQAVQEFLKSENLPNTYVSIYRLGRSLTVARYYTDDKQLLAGTVDSIAKGLRTDDGLGTQAAVVGASYSSLQALANNVLNSSTSTQAMQDAVRNAILNPLPSIARDPLLARGVSSQDASFTLGNAILAQALIENGLRFATSLSEGMNTIDSLREIVRAQENLPGRKLVLYLSDGLTLPVNRRDAFENLISYANRAGVAFYAVDTRGLNLEDPIMRSLAEQERTAAVSSSTRSDPINGVKEDDSVQLTVVSDRQMALRELAESTGGFAVTDTNEIALPMQRVMEDIRFHYELAYSPANRNYDAKFRKITVKILRPKVVVQTRKGYFALPDLNGQSLQPFEAAALNAINFGSTSQTPQYRLAAMKFRPYPKGVEHEITFEVPLSGLQVVQDQKTKKSRVRVALFAVIRDSNGEVVTKLGRQLVREIMIASGNPEPANWIFYAEPVLLAPGHYRVDAAVTDEQSGKTSIKHLALFVAPSNDLGLSSLAMVRRPETSSSASSRAPLIAANSDLVPTLSESIPYGNALDVFFVLYPAHSQPQAPKVVLQMLHDGKELVRKPVDLPHPDPDGSIPVRLRLSPTQGQCDIFVVAQQGKLVAGSSLSVKVE